ncbi:hypothetical protein [Volucribacter amazonae]|uniref:Uncharacterized protein n=1 Tax=Volucribacter amazonae TaxID=256731 RepID=A0A9X4PIX7_9PAST|nr:hypothetical protein [Volucribacter amazonae]MDG6896185.1 hypothetical protein [Volucribacter amazonae]
MLDHSRVYNNYLDFFHLNGNAIIKLTPSAAIELCYFCTENNLIVGYIEGGIWRNKLFQARIDCIWGSSLSSNSTKSSIRDNNRLAIKFIKEESDIHNAFILTIFRYKYNRMIFA